MDKTIEQLLKSFNHLARDLFVYFLSGFIVVLNLLYLDHIFNESCVFCHIKIIKYWFIVILIITYLIGHLIFAIMYFVFELTGFEDSIKKKLFSNDTDQNAFSIDTKKEIEVFIKEVGSHGQFIERHTQLYLMRWNLAGGLIVNSLTNILMGITFYFYFGYVVLIVLFFTLGILIYILSLKTEKDCADRISLIHTQITNSK